MQGKDWADRRKALDPTIYRAKYYVLNIDVDAEIGGIGGGAKTIDNTPFVLERITHGISFRPDGVNQDGNYTLQFRDDQSVYNTEPALAQMLFGGVFNGNRVLDLPLRMFFQGSSTLNIDVVNYTDRTGGGVTNFQLGIVFHGFERWDSPRQ